MRYQNWDVLLFPGSSRIPIQEFDTKYHVFPQQNGHIINNIPSTETGSTVFDVIDRLPMLTSFIPSLDQGAAFRVSLHSWESPKPSRTLSNIMTAEEAVVYEARVYIDGRMVSQKLFGEQVIWPEVIEFIGTIQSGTTGKVLRFPPFYNEILDQAHWNANAMFGRIKVVIAEGVLQHFPGQENASTPGFDRLRDVVAFSFQHAPLHILEYSAIAWPNTRVLRKVQIPINQRRSLSNDVMPVSNYETHAHSPPKYEESRAKTHADPLAAFPKLIDTRRSISSKDARSKTTSDALAPYDPFLGPSHITLRDKPTLSSSHDISMPDYASIRTMQSQAGTEMSDISYRGVDFQKHMDEAAVVEIVHALSPAKREELFYALSLEHHQPFQIRKGSMATPLAQNIRSGSVIRRLGTPCEIRSETVSRQCAQLPGTFSTHKSGKSLVHMDQIRVNVRDRLSAANINSKSGGPALVSIWKEQNKGVNSGWMNNKPNLTPTVRPRSSSTASKRKRTISLSHVWKTPEKPPSVAKNLTSPLKKIDTPDRCINHAEGGVSLSGSRWAKKT